MSVVYTGGTFDIPHAGHIQFLRKCKNYGSWLVVALNTDEFIMRFKNKRPIMSFPERYEVIRSIEYVDEVIPNLSGEDSKPTIMSVNPDHIVIGDDWISKDYYKQMGFTKEWLKEQGIELHYVPYTKNISSTEIRRRANEY